MHFYVSILHRIAVLICNSVLVVRQSNEFADVVQTVAQSKLSTVCWLRTKRHPDADPAPRGAYRGRHRIS